MDDPVSVYIPKEDKHHASGKLTFIFAYIQHKLRHT